MRQSVLSESVVDAVLRDGLCDIISRLLHIVRRVAHGYADAGGPDYQIKLEVRKMAEHNVLLVCGSGASSGFMAANIRKAAAAHYTFYDLLFPKQLQNLIQSHIAVQFRVSFLVDQCDLDIVSLAVLLERRDHGRQMRPHHQTVKSKS